MSGFMLFIPMYNCEAQITRTLAQVTPEVQAQLAEVFVVDNRSSDGGAQAALRYASENLTGVPTLVVRNDANQGLGGSHKVAFQRCLDQGYRGVIVLHGDDQGRLSDILPAIEQYSEAECILGARFMPASRLQGYSLHRIAANIVFNGIFSTLSRRVLWDLGSGLNVYRRAFVERRLWDGCADDLTFNYHLILRTAIVPDCSIAFHPISWREDDQVSNAKLFRHGLTMIKIVKEFLMDPQAFARRDYSEAPQPRTWKEVT
ncbi:MAG: glycosyltransferase family 2 protein [Deltaproteobacteria bacterium]|nr:MAG: glycosyltransferase family 2 protein [Deltaproteobacteria bacterium]